MTSPPFPRDGFDNPTFLEGHVRSILDFYEDRAFDEQGGFFHTYKDNGDIYDPGLRHLVSSTRFVFNYATAYRMHGTSHYLKWAKHGLKYLSQMHLQAEGHYAWELKNGQVSDGRAMAYGHAFVMLAGASSLQAGLSEGREFIDSAWQILEDQFWDADHEAYADERDATLQVLDPYRGQNANMHTCEALLAAWEATGAEKFIDRASLLAERFAGKIADQSGGLIWEHYTKEWQVDLEYNRDKPDDLFKPWGFQPGHQVEWAKLLLVLNSHKPSTWLVEQATSLYQVAMETGWDDEFGGLVYGFAPDGTFADSHKYFWVQAEAFAAAWRLHQVTGEDRYLNDYRRLWEWSWTHLIDHKDGAWFRIRNRDGSRVDDLKSPPGKTDYHTLGACWDVLSQS